MIENSIIRCWRRVSVCNLPCHEVVVFFFYLKNYTGKHNIDKQSISLRQCCSWTSKTWYASFQNMCAFSLWICADPPLLSSKLVFTKNQLTSLSRKCRDLGGGLSEEAVLWSHFISQRPMVWGIIAQIIRTNEIFEAQQHNLHQWQ